MPRAGESATGSTGFTWFAPPKCLWASLWRSHPSDRRVPAGVRVLPPRAAELNLVGHQRGRGTDRTWADSLEYVHEVAPFRQWSRTTADTSWRPGLGERPKCSGSYLPTGSIVSRSGTCVISRPKCVTVRDRRLVVLRVGGLPCHGRPRHCLPREPCRDLPQALRRLRGEETGSTEPPSCRYGWAGVGFGRA
jgi:hypothetical protein